MRTRSELLLTDLVWIRAEKHPELDVLTFERDERPPEVRTYADLVQNANRIAAALVARGLARGERFGLMLRNHPEFVETMIAASTAACVFVPIDPRMRGEKLAYVLRNSGCRGIVCADYCLGAVQDVRAAVPQLAWVLALETGEDCNCLRLGSVPAVDSLCEVLSKPVPTVDVRLAGPSDPLQIIYTSGTTGDPKGVVFPNQRFGAFALLGGLLGYRPDDRPYTGLSLTHGNAQAVTLGPSLHMGLRAVFSRRFTKSRLWDVTRRFGCTTFSMLGGMATGIYAEPLRPDDSDNPVRVVVSAGMPAAIWEGFEKRFGVQVFEWYGAVEGGLAFKPIGVGPVGSFGKPAPGLEMKIVEENGNECGPGVVGEIVCRPASGEDASVEYFGNEEASRAKTRGGWLRSGDMGHRDVEGWFFFDYRKGGGIRHNGDFVNPGFVEKVIAEQPCVADVFVYGVPARSGSPGEKDVVAAIVLTPRAAFDPQAVFAACRRGLEPNFVPAYLQVVDEIPKTASEKPQERFLLERFKPGGPVIYTEASSGPELAGELDPASVGAP
ncbi:MAG TPA: ATP-dependent acyl-CoA ligase [Deltaproteobacteria bacterium]|jgi:crotonobetaine/carnitine-CoA ligase|nr:ATP-dependent acyl-CoA ligase [Deltaproteobacteria bacterium]